ncbi:Heme peroxidase [Teratosphaeria destructans]|uniref:Peroxidase n=1 Tax=Teratosphaeria destructans TaxID=418781 RepID=A0A9W7SNJ7_9PEZI|nr:Heme peroxidase [Teratosphaeria destructans]
MLYQQLAFVFVIQSIPSVYGQSCPSFWKTIASDLSSNFLENGECNGRARQAIRFGFHDAFAWTAQAGGGADGSLLLNPEEITREENSNMQDYHTFLTDKRTSYQNQYGQIGAADLIQFAAQVAVRTCPGGPRVKTVIGRIDSSTAGPTGQLNRGFGDTATQAAILANWQSKGFSAKDVAALLGSHTVSRATISQPQGIPTDGQQDATPGRWDTEYFKDTLNPPQNVWPLESDKNCAVKGTEVGDWFQSFIDNAGAWDVAYTDAAYRLSLVGVSNDFSAGFIDCTDALPAGASAKMIRSAPVNGRAR